MSDRLNRRRFLKRSALVAVAAMVRPGRCLPGAAEAPAAPRAKRPNIVFVLADDLGYGDIGCYGQKKIRTPHIDSLAAEGMRFTDFYAGAAVCIPSRSCLMTGLDSGHTRHGISNSHVPLLDGDVTLAEVLRAAGYQTGCIGKWALGDKPDGPGAAHRQGWNYYYGEPNQTTCHSYWLEHMWEFDRDGSVSGLPPDQGLRKVDLPPKTWAHEELAKHALAFLDAKAKRKEPFFLYVPFCIPHGRYEVPSLEPYAKENWPETEKAYAAMITRMDADVGRILARLKEHGIDEQTLVIFSSDNGPVPGRLKFFDSAGPLRGAKASFFEGGIRVPFVVRWPGRARPGGVYRTPLAFWDVLPTAADVAGAKAPDNLDGVSFLPALLGKTQPEHEFLYWQDRAVRTGRWKAHCAKGKLTALYDLAADIGETRDATADHADVAVRIERYFASRLER